MEDCIFCKIVSGDIPSAKLVETGEAICFLDINPINPGHALIVPTRHVESVLELNQDELHACISLAQRIAGAVMAATESPGCNIHQSNHRCAGQVIPHTHFHVIPRRPGDGFSFRLRQGSYGEGELEQMQQRIRQRL